MEYHTIRVIALLYVESGGVGQGEEEDSEEELIMREKEELEDAPVYATWVQLTAIFGSSQSTTMSF